MKWTLQEIAELCGGVVHQGDPSFFVHKLYYDTRRILDGKGGLFIALHTPANDGHRFIEDAIRKGISALLISRIPENVSIPQNVGIILVPDTWEALRNWAKANRSQFRGTVVGITGSWGKTTIKEWLFEILSEKFSVYRSPRSYNTFLGVSLSLINMPSDNDYALVEAGISAPGEMAPLQDMIKPEGGIFTSFGIPHQQNFSSLREKLYEKLQLFVESEWLVAPYSAIGREGMDWLRQRNDKLEFFIWATENTQEDAFLRVVRIDRRDNGISMIDVEDFEGRWSLEVPFVDRASLQNIITVITVLRKLGYKPDEVISRIKGFKPLSQRLQLYSTRNRSIVIEDTYSADISSLETAIEYLNMQSGRRKKALIISDMEVMTHEVITELINVINTSKFQRLILLGETLSRLANQFNAQETYALTSTGDLIELVGTLNWENFAILIKGSRKYRLERLKYWFHTSLHPARLEINLHALISNINRFRQVISPSTGIIAMVKALAYGSGDIQIASTLQRMRVNYLAVAYPEEGRRLREGGITGPIIVMNPYGITQEDIKDYKLEPVLHSFHQLWLWNQWGIEIPVHVEVDTGLGRLGFKHTELNQLIDTIKRSQTLVPVSVFSHLASADNPSQDNFTLKQLSLFDAVTRRFSKEFPEIKKHVLNTAGTIRFPEYQYDFVRLGIGLYGIDPTGLFTGLEPVHTLRASIIQVKTLEKGESVGYNRQFVAEKPTRVGVVSIGYADGLPYSNNLYAFVNGRIVPVLGKPFMDLCIIDVSDVDVVVGDEVVFYGEEIRLEEVAQHVGESPYTLISKVSQRIPRVYVYE